MTKDQQYLYEPEPKKGVNPWLIALIAVVVIICVCCFCAIVGLVLLGPSVGNVFSTIIETMEAITPVP